MSTETLDAMLGRWYVERVLRAQGDRDGVKEKMRALIAGDPAFQQEAQQRLDHLRKVTQMNQTDPNTGAPILRDFISSIHQELLEAVL